MGLCLIYFKENNGDRTKSPTMFLIFFFLQLIVYYTHSKFYQKKGVGGWGDEHKPNRQAISIFQFIWLSVQKKKTALIPITLGKWFQ